MSFADERSAIEQHFLAAWDELTPVEIAGIPFNAVAGQEYIRLGIRSGNREPASLDAQWIRGTGMVVVDIFTPHGLGSERARQLADQVATALDLQHIHSPGIRSINFLTTSIVEDLEANPGWFRVQATCPFEHDSYRGPVPDVLTDDTGGTLFGQV